MVTSEGHENKMVWKIASQPHKRVVNYTTYVLGFFVTTNKMTIWNLSGVIDQLTQPILNMQKKFDE